MTTKIIPKNRKKDFESFQHYCLRNNLEFLLDLWDYDLNGDIDPDNIGAHSTKQKIYFKCPRGIHGSRAIYLNGICKSPERAREYDICIGCKSIGQHIIDNYGMDYLDRIWSDKNEKSYFEIYAKSGKKIFLRCLNDKTHPDYDLLASNFDKSHNCPYCAGKRVCHKNSLGYIYPQSLEVWSDKNNKTPYDYTHGSQYPVWWKCENKKHKDYRRQIDRSSVYNFKCPECGRENKRVLKGEDAPNWKGGITPEIKALRKSDEYKQWRTAVYERDNYTCQCCGKHGGSLRAHHIHSFSSHKHLRFDINNGITLCDACHDSSVIGGFHNIHGTHDKTPYELETYINNKRKQLGIDIPFTIDDYQNRINILKPENLNIENLIPIEIKQEPNGSFI